MEEKHMERIKRFFWDDRATAEATSTVIMIASVGLLLAAGLITWYGGIQDFFNGAAGQVTAGNENWPVPGGS